MDPRDQMPYQMPGGMHPAPNMNMNHPPQIFGQYPPTDGLPMHHMPPEMAAQMFPDQMMMEDTTEAKKRRIAKVCGERRAVSLINFIDIGQGINWFIS